MGYMFYKFSPSKAIMSLRFKELHRMKENIKHLERTGNPTVRRKPRKPILLFDRGASR